METKFVTFGCWNEDCCDESKPVVRVLNKINNEDSDASFFIVTGDNYYPKKDKETGKKITDKTQLLTSFELLREKLLTTEDKELFLLLGNHDVEKTIQEGEQQEESNCYVSNFEKDFIEQHFTSGKKIHFPKELVMFKKIGEHTLIIMIDTNIYSGEDLTCYEWIERRDEEIEEFRAKLQHLQQQKIIDILKEEQREKYKNIFVCGHNPLIGFKNQKVKDGKVKGGIDTCHEKLYELLFSLQEHGESFYYLCADIHNYQMGTVTIETGPGTKPMKINQHIVGIGGTELDENYNEGFNPKFKKKEDGLQRGIVEASTQIGQYKINYTINEHFSVHGYLVVTIGIDHNVMFEIKKIGIISAGKSKRSSRTRTRRSRSRTRRSRTRTRRSRTRY